MPKYRHYGDFDMPTTLWDQAQGKAVKIIPQEWKPIENEGRTSAMTDQEVEELLAASTSYQQRLNEAIISGKPLVIRLGTIDTTGWGYRDNGLSGDPYFRHLYPG